MVWEQLWENKKENTSIYLCSFLRRNKIVWEPGLFISLPTYFSFIKFFYFLSLFCLVFNLSPIFPPFPSHQSDLCTKQYRIRKNQLVGLWSPLGFLKSFYTSIFLHLMFTWIFEVPFITLLLKNCIIKADFHLFLY